MPLTVQPFNVEYCATYYKMNIVLQK